MSCLALSLQPTNGPDILLQTREWFPPARALVALSAFRQTRRVYASGKQNSSSEDADSSLGDDPLAASGGQVIVGVESKYRVVYRLVNGVYVLGITTVDEGDGTNNVFECIGTVNQAVSVIVAACRGVDVTPEKLHRKYAEIYMALDLILRGVSNIRLAVILSSIHGEGIVKMVSSSNDTENRIRGADNWATVEAQSLEHQANVELFSAARFELPAETLAAGDEIASTLIPTSQSTVAQTSEQQDQKQNQEESSVEKDPFAASDALNKPQELVGGFKKTQDASTNDLTLALAGLEITPLPPASATKSTFVRVEGFEGEYGGIEFANEDATLNEAFEGFNDAFGGGLDASEFVGPKKVPKSEGLGGLEELQSGQGTTAATVKAETTGSTPLDNLLAKKEPQMTVSEMYISEEINAEFRESLLARVGLQGVVFLRTLPPKVSAGKETEFSFKLECTEGVKRAAINESRISSLGNGMFHVRTPSSEEPIPLIKYSLQPRYTILPLRVRLIKRHSGTLLSAMIQYASNPNLLIPLSNVTFIMKLPVDPTLLKVTPKAILNRSEKQLKWHVGDIPLKGRPGCLKARMPVEEDSNDPASEGIEIVGLVQFSMKGSSTLSGISLSSISDDKNDFHVVDHKYASGIYMCR